MTIAAWATALLLAAGADAQTAPPPPPPPPAMAAPSPAPPPPLTEKLPVNATMWTLPSGCTPVSAAGASYFVCGPKRLRAVQSDKGTSYAVVTPP